MDADIQSSLIGQLYDPPTVEVGRVRIWIVWALEDLRLLRGVDERTETARSFDGLNAGVETGTRRGGIRMKTNPDHAV